METGLPSARLGSWRPLRHCGAAAPPATLILGHHIHAIGNGPVEVVSPGSADVTLESVIGLGIVAYQIDWSPPRPDLSFVEGCGSFHGADPLLPVPNPLPICVTAPALGLYHHIADVPRCLKSSGVSGPIPLPIRTFHLLLNAPYPPTASAFSPSTSIPEKILRNCSGRAPLNAPQTSPLLESHLNPSFVGEPHGGRQL